MEPAVSPSRAPVTPSHLIGASLEFHAGSDADGMRVYRTPRGRRIWMTVRASKQEWLWAEDVTPELRARRVRFEEKLGVIAERVRLHGT